MLSFLLGALLTRTPKPLADLPFESEPGRIWLKARLNGKPIDAALDTGAQWCMADADAASRAGAKAGGLDVTMHAVGGRHIDAWSTSGLTFTLDGLDATQIVDYAIDLGRVQRKGERHLDFLIGGDFLRRFVVEIDYPASRVRFYDPMEYTPRAGMQRMPLRFEDGRPVAPMTLKLPGDAERKVSALVDTGATGITLTGSFVRREGLLKRYPEAKPTKGAEGIAGTAPARILPDAAGSLGIQDFTSVFLDTTKGGQTGPDAPYDALVGGDVLANCVVAFNYGESTLSMGYFPPSPVTGK